MATESNELVQDYTLDIQKLDQEVKRLQQENDALRESQAKLNKEYKNGTITTEQFKDRMKETTAALKKNQGMARDLVGALGGLSPQLSGLANSVAGLFTGPLGVISAVSAGITFMWNKMDEARKRDEEKHKKYIQSITNSMAAAYDFQINKAKAAGATDIEAITHIMNVLNERRAEAEARLKKLPTTQEYLRTSAANRKKMFDEAKAELAATLTNVAKFRDRLQKAQQDKIISDIAERYAKEKEYAQEQAELNKTLEEKIKDLQILTIEDAKEQKIAKIKLEESRQLASYDKIYATATEQNKKLILKVKQYIKETTELQIRGVKDVSKVSNTEIDKHIAKVRDFLQTYQSEFKVTDPQLAADIQKLNGLLSEEAHLIETRNAKDKEFLSQREKDIDVVLKKYQDTVAKINELEEETTDPSSLEELEARRGQAYAEMENNRVAVTVEANQKIEQNHLETARRIEELEKQNAKVTLDAWGQALGGVGDVFNALAETEDENSKKSIKLQIAGIFMSMASALATGIAQATTAGWPALLATVPATIAMLIANFAQVKKLKKQAGFAKGGLVSGPGSGTSDSINAKLSNGESVMTARATSQYGDLLSAINTSVGGNPIVSASRQDTFINKLAAAVSNTPAPIVSVESIDRQRDVIKQVDVLSKL